MVSNANACYTYRPSFLLIIFFDPVETFAEAMATEDQAQEEDLVSWNSTASSCAQTSLTSLPAAPSNFLATPSQSAEAGQDQQSNQVCFRNQPKLAKKLTN